MTAYVEAQLWAFDWPGDEGYKRQYRDLMSAWSRLSEEDDIAKRVFLAEGRFDWLVWWKLSHTDPRFLPSGCEAIFAVYHFMGMVGVSEAKAESVASLLKRYKGNSPLGTDRIIEKAILRNCGVDGLSFDDVFLTRCWVEYFGGMEKDKFSFRVQAENRRAGKICSLPTKICGNPSCTRGQSHTSATKVNAERLTARLACCRLRSPRAREPQVGWVGYGKTKHSFKN